MEPTSPVRKRVATFDPEHRSRVVIHGLLERLGFEVDAHETDHKLESRLLGPKRADLVFLHLAIFGSDWDTIMEKLGALRLNRNGLPPVLAVSSLPLGEPQLTRLVQLGCSEVISRKAHLLEVLFAFNRLMFPKMRELRRYTRVFGGFAVSFRAAGTEEPFSEGLVYNVSREGAFIQAERTAPEGGRLEIRFQLPGEEAPAEVEAIVSWINPPNREADPLSPPGMGVSFLTLTEARSAELARFLEAKNEPEPAKS